MDGSHTPISNTLSVNNKAQCITSQSGATSVEFVVSLSAFILIILFLFEICRFIALASTLNLSLAEAGRLTSREKLTDSTYLEILNKHIRDENKTFAWFFFKEATAEELRLDIKYCNNADEIINNLCNDDSKRKIAVYNVTYCYSTLFLPFSTHYFNGLTLNNDIIYVQEHVNE